MWQLSFSAFSKSQTPLPCVQLQGVYCSTQLMAHSIPITRAHRQSLQSSTAPFIPPVPSWAPTALPYPDRHTSSPEQHPHPCHNRWKNTKKLKSC